MLYFADDKPSWNEHTRALVRSQLNIPALHTIGHTDTDSCLASLPLHYHHTMEFVVIIKGRQRYTVDNQVYSLQGGDIFMTFPEEVHGNGDKFPLEICEYIWFQLDFSSSEHFLGMIPPYDEYLFEQLRNYQSRITHTSQQDLLSLRRGFKLLCQEDMQSHLLGYHYFLEFVLKNLCTGEGKNLQGQEDDPFFSGVLNYIHAHLTENPSLESIAGHFGMSFSRFNARFKEQMGITPHAYITNLKIDTAKILLRNPENTITDVAFQLNYSSSNHFSSVFKKYTGCTPSQYRKSRYPEIL